MLTLLAGPLDYGTALLDSDRSVALISLQVVAKLSVLTDPPPLSVALGTVGVVNGDSTVGLEVENIARSGPPSAGRRWND